MHYSDPPVALQLPGRGDSEEVVGSRAVGQWARQQEAGEKPAERVALLLEEHQHTVHRLDTHRVVAWRREERGSERDREMGERWRGRVRDPF